MLGSTKRISQGFPRQHLCWRELLHTSCSSQAFSHPQVLTDPVPAGEVYRARARHQAEGHWRLQLEVVQTQLQRGRDGAELVA